MPEPDLSKKLLNMGAGSREEGGLGARKQNVEEYDDATSGPPALPKATPAQDNPDKINKKAKYGDRKGEVRIPVDQMIRPLGSFKKGTDYVPKTGIYKLHEGEAVKTAEENKMDPMALVPGRSEEKPNKVVHEIRSRKAHSGGVIHEHHHTHPEHHKMEEHTSPDAAAAGAHVASMLGEGAPPADAGAPPAAGAPAV